MLKRTIFGVFVLCVCTVVSQAVPLPTITKDNTGKPNWVNKPDDAFDKTFYVAAVGSGSGPEKADASAFGNLTGFFGQSVQSKTAILESYKEKVFDGAVSVESNTEAEEAILLSSSMDQLIGAEINDRWYDAQHKIYFAVAIMEKPRTIKLYGDLIDGNVRLINTLLDIPIAERASFDTIGKYRLASDLADANQVFAIVLSLLGESDRTAELKTGDDYRNEARNIIKLIPVRVVVDNDLDGRIGKAFAVAFTDAGFRTGNARSRYVLQVTVSLSLFEGDRFVFSQYLVTADLVDTRDDTVLIPYKIEGREGHRTQKDADVRAIRAAEGQIKEDFFKVLGTYLGSAPQD
jgi:hypothetical protein